MTDLSPAAQAVVAAIEKFDWEAGHFSREDIWMNSREVTAAALRAAAHEVAPFPGRYPMNEYMEGFREAKQSIHHQLIAIAAELEGQ